MSCEPPVRTDPRSYPLSGLSFCGFWRQRFWKGWTMPKARPTYLLIAASLLALMVIADPHAQSGLPNPYRPVKGLADGGGPSVPGGDWAKLPGGREMGPPA